MIFCKLRRRFSFVSLSSFLETILLSKTLISRIFLKPNQFSFQKKKMMEKNIDRRKKKMVEKMRKMLK